MFTLKWVAANGSQQLYSGVNEVSYTPPDLADSKEATVSFSTGNTHCSITSGRIYVMNDKGQTVERYVLKDDREFPHGLQPNG